MRSTRFLQNQDSLSSLQIEARLRENLPPHLFKLCQREFFTKSKGVFDEILRETAKHRTITRVLCILFPPLFPILSAVFGLSAITDKKTGNDCNDIAHGVLQTIMLALILALPKENHLSENSVDSLPQLFVNAVASLKKSTR